MSDGGKGSSPRPFSVDQKTFDSNWDAIFGKKKKEKTFEQDAEEMADAFNEIFADELANYEQDDGPLTEDQIKQIEESVKNERTLDRDVPTQDS